MENQETFIAKMIQRVKNRVTGKRIKDDENSSCPQDQVEENCCFWFKNTTQGIVFHNSKGELIDCNPAAEKILGLTLVQLRGLTSFDPRWKAIREDGMEFPGSEFPAVITLKTGKPVNNAVMGVFNPINETYRWININSFPKFKGKETLPFMVIVTFEDITERKKIEIELAESNQRYYTFFEQGQDGIVIINPEDGSFIEFNNQVCKQLEYSREEFANLKIFDIEALETAEQTMLHINKVLKEGKDEFITKHITRTRQFIDVKVSTRIISVGGKSFYHSIWRDITEITKKEAEIILSKKKSEESNANFRAIIENTFNSIWAINTDYQLTFVNQVFKDEYFKAFRERLEIGDDVISKLPQPLQSVWKDRYQRVFNFEQFTVEDEIQDLSGASVFIQVSLCPIISNGKIIGASIYGSDITQRKQQEHDLLLAKEKAEDSEIVFRSAFEYSGIGMAMVSLDKNFLKVNRAFCKMMEYTEEELVGREFLSITHPDDLQTGIKELGQTISGELDFFNCTKRYVRKSGDIAWGNLSVSIIRNSHKEPLFWVAQVEDITVQVKYQHDLITAKDTAEKNEKLFRALFENMGNSASLYEVVTNSHGEPVDYRYLAVNPHYERNLGFEETYLIGKTLLEIYPGTEKLWLDAFKEVVQTGLPARIESYSGEVDRYFELIVYVPQKNQIALIGADITDRKKSEIERENLLKEVTNALNEVAASKEKLNEIMERVSDGFVAFDSDFNYTYVNEHGAELLGRKPEDLIGKNYWTEYPEAKGTPFAKAYVEAFETQQAVFFEDYYEHWDRWFVNRIYPSKDGITIFFTEITTRKKAEAEILAAKEKAEESDRLKTAFLQNMSHEIRTPMNAIMGFADLMPKYIGNEPKLKFFSEIIRHRSSDLLEIINDILDIAKIESGQLSINRENFLLKDLFKDINEFYTGQQLRMKNKNISFVVNISDELKCLEINTDIIKLKQILINLISNALKFTNEGKIEVSCYYNKDNKLQFSVSDTGIGIPEDKHKFVFERFTQLEKGAGNNSGGTGLGLSIVRGLVNLLGGKIWLESSVNVGSTFYFTVA